MARVTVEDCLENVNSRFDLVIMASKRANSMINNGYFQFSDDKKEKATVVALREIAESETPFQNKL